MDFFPFSSSLLTVSTLFFCFLTLACVIYFYFSLPWRLLIVSFNQCGPFSSSSNALFSDDSQFLSRSLFCFVIYFNP